MHFIVNTGLPMTYLSDDVISAFGLTISNTNDFINTRINNKDTIIMMSPPGLHFSEVNILGSEFMKISGVTLVVEYCNNRFTLRF